MPRPSCCPACSGPGDPLGSLGSTQWMRCRRCGPTYGHPPRAWRDVPTPATPVRGDPDREAPPRDAGTPPG